VWDVDLQRHEGTVKDIILVVKGEMALEEFLKQVTHTPRSSRVNPDSDPVKRRRDFQSLLRLRRRGTRTSWT
jgi:hypothetical protein